MRPVHLPPVPPSVTSPSGGKLRRTLLAIVVVLIITAAYGFVRLGTFFAREDALQKSDAIFVLAGTEMTRPLEGGDLYQEGYAPRIVMTRETREPAFAIIEHRGAKISSQVERARDVLIELGIPATAIIIPDRIHDSTAAEAITLRELARVNHWQTVIIVSSKFHLRRAHFAFERELRGTGVRVLMRGSRYDDARPERWWRQRSDVRDILQELPKFVAYLCGLGA
jgi:uncharacterized SAM-binding protein YcdF (DUF218 family)